MSSPRRGRGPIIAGIVLLAVSVVGGVIGLGVFGARLSFDVFERDIAISGGRDRIVPGTIPFQVLEPIDEADPAEMTVGIALSDQSGAQPECTIRDADGNELALASATSNDTLVDQRYVDWLLVGTARLGPGDYEATCEVVGEPSASSGVSFTVGRAFGVADVEEFIGPALGAMAVFGVAGLVFVIGVVLLIVGLVQRSKSRQPPYTSGPYGGAPGYGAPAPYGPPGGYGQPGGYPQPPPPGGYGQPGGYGPSSGYGQPGGSPQPPPPGGYGPSGGYGQPGGPPQPAPPGPYGQPDPYAPPPAPPAPPPDRTPPPEDGSVGGWTVPPSKQ